jgi:hypothetical protein
MELDMIHGFAFAFGAVFGVAAGVVTLGFLGFIALVVIAS